MTHAELLRRRAFEAEARARSYADRADTTDDPEARAQLRQVSDMEAIAARVFGELAQVEDELEEEAA